MTDSTAQSPETPDPSRTRRPVNRVLSEHLTAALLRTPLTPNQVTLLGFLVGAGGLVLLARGGYAAALAGAALFELQAVLDNCDGEIARRRGLSSPFGAWLDRILDIVLVSLLFPAVAMGLIRAGGAPAFMIALGAAGGLGAGGTAVLFAIRYARGRRIVRVRRIPARLTRALDALSRGDFGLMLLAGALFGILHYFLWAAAAGTVIFLLAALLLDMHEAPIQERDNMENRKTDCA
ncbi:MAG: CDP-alcohol phosphatidyltransferase family protein [Planctomycetota bacterium]